ncbi:hypothetical protein [Pseudonocardia sp. Ae505_Ps2]|uniref:hypothetical protein n=1 Tax=Pseudonocardia sp. Ae505_Ps2 TaxID=1885034 RepID=UPI00094E516C|nr:hypothetical protein [Pseudonocardia sp. Ae505_Ps2]
MTVTPDEVVFEPNTAEKRLRADGFSGPAHDIRSVSVEPRSIRRPTSWGSHRVLCIETPGRESVLRLGVDHGRHVAPLVSAILTGAEDERAVRRIGRKVRHQFPTVSLWGQAFATSLLLLAQLGPALLWGDAPLDAGRISLSIMIALLMSVYLAVLVHRGVQRSSA